MPRCSPAMTPWWPRRGPASDRSDTSTSVAARVTLHGSAIEIMAGEILGVAALEGAASRFLRMLAGREPSPYDSIIPGVVGFVPENRQEDAVVGGFSLIENLALKNAAENHGLLDWSQLRQATTTVIKEFDVRADGPDTLMQNLSGGNQQRFVLGRELDGNPPLLVLENPTQGLDVNAAASIHARVHAARNAGTAVVFYSSDLDELAEIADRVLVVSTSTTAFAAPNRDEIGRLLLGTATAEHTIG